MTEIKADFQMCNGMQPEIEPGDLLVILPGKEKVKDNDIAFMLLDGNRIIRRIRHDKNGLWLIPKNNAFASDFIGNEEMGRVCIMGKVVERRRSYN